VNLRTDHAKERNAKDKVLSVNVGWQLEARTGAQRQGCESCPQANWDYDWQRFVNGKNGLRLFQV
jgi:hypothetical protein